MNKRKVIKILAVVAVMLALIFLFSVTVFAAGDVAGAVKSTWDAAKTQIKSVVNNVIFPALSLILAVLFFVKVGSAWFEYRKHGQFEFAAPAILFACLVFSLTAPTYIWTIIG